MADQWPLPRPDVRERQVRQLQNHGQGGRDTRPDPSSMNSDNASQQNYTQASYYHNNEPQLVSSESEDSDDSTQTVRQTYSESARQRPGNQE